MAIELEKKRRLNISRWPIIILFFSFIGILFLVSSYFYLNKELAVIENEIEVKKESLKPTTEEKEIEKKVQLISERIRLFQNLISKHRDTSKIFSIIENDCLPNVQFTNFNFNADNLTINLSGKTDNFISLQQQVDVFKEDQLVDKAVLSDMSVDQDNSGITFSISLSINQKVFNENNID